MSAITMTALLSLSTLNAVLMMSLDWLPFVLFTKRSFLDSVKGFSNKESLLEILFETRYYRFQSRPSFSLNDLEPELLNQKIVTIFFPLFLQRFGSKIVEQRWVTFSPETFT